METALIGGRPAGAGLTAGLAIAAFVSSLGAAGFGFGLGAPNELETIIESDLSSVVSHNSVQWSAVLASFTAAGFAATQFTPKYVDSLGRRPILLAIQLVFALGGAIMLAAGLTRASQHLAYALLIIGRLVFGLAAGAATVVVPMYLGEIAPPALTGALGALNQFQVTVWILVAQALGIGMATSSLWGWLFGISGALGAASFALSLFTLPESPRWLVSKGREAEARTILVRLRAYGADDAEQELADIRRGIEATAVKEAPSFRQLLADRGLRKALIIAVVLQIAQQLSGINAVFFFSTGFFTDAGVQNSNYATLACGAVNVAATAFAMWAIDKAGRKPLLLVGAAGMMLSAAALTATLVAKETHPEATSALGATSIVFVLLFVTFFEVGLGPIPWLIGGEMLPEGPRSTVMALAAAANWIFTTVVALTFPSVQAALGHYSFLPFCAFLGLTFVFTLVWVPETKGRAPAQVLRQLGGAGHAGVEGDDERSIRHGTAASSINGIDPESEALMRLVETA